MTARFVFASILLICTVARTGSAQGTSPAVPETARPPAEATQFDFLIGEWELTVTPKVSGLAARLHGVPKLHGTWKAWHAPDGWGIDDELRITDAAGNPRSHTQSARRYDASSRRWRITTADTERQRTSQASAHWNGREMVSIGRGTGHGGETYTTRTRFTRITPDSFRYQQDRSRDGGRSWEEAVLVIEARRTAASARR